jgi:hypothetical protein
VAQVLTYALIGVLLFSTRAILSLIEQVAYPADRAPAASLGDNPFAPFAAHADYINGTNGTGTGTDTNTSGGGGGCSAGSCGCDSSGCGGDTGE